MKREDTVAFSIDAGYGDLRPSEKKAADYILENMKEVRDMSLSQLAARCRVSQPTIVRMVKALGYEGFRSFKDAIIEEMAQESGERQSPYAIYGYSISENDELSDVPAKMAAAASAMIERSIKALSLKTYQKVIKVIESAGQIDIYGIENSSSACCDLETKLTYLGLSCRYLEDPYLQRISAASLSEKDVAIGISYSGASRDTVDALKMAKKQGAATIVITNFRDSLISKYADYLLCTTQEQLFYGNAIFSRTSQTLIVDMIYMVLLTSDYKTYSERLDKNSRIIRNKAYHRSK